jgi:sugar phosphate isomerase/epimerase
MKLVGSDVDYLLIEDYAKSSLEKAAEVGAETVVFGSGVSRQVPEGFSNARAREQLIALLDRISDIARTFGISIVIEPLNKEECNIINSTSEAVQLVEDVEKHNIRLLIDFYHYCSEIEPTFKNAEKYLQHIHFARPCGRGFPQRMEEDERYAQFFNELRRMKYDKRISIEAYTTDFPRDARNALDFLHAAFRGDARQVVREL